MKWLTRDFGEVQALKHITANVIYDFGL
jgi:hypothetical protein